MDFLKSLTRKWKHFGQLSGAERRQLLQVLMLLSVISALRRLLSFNRLRALLSRWTTGRAEFPPSDAGQMHHTVRMVQAAAAYALPRPNCLDRSLTLWFLLGRRGIASELVFGVRHAENTLDAHAWVAYQGTVLNDTPDVAERYVVIHPEAAV